MASESVFDVVFIDSNGELRSKRQLHGNLYDSICKKSRARDTEDQCSSEMFGDEHEIFYRFNQMVFYQSFVRVPRVSINVSNMNGFISFGDK